MTRNRSDGPEMLPFARSLTEEKILIANKVNCKAQGILREMWQEAYEKGGNLSFKVVSGSMSPMIEVGDVVTIGRTDHCGVRIGDIVAFVDNQNVVVHRIIGKSRSNQQLSFYHRGDSGASSGKIIAQNLIGRVLLVEKKGHKIRLDSRRHIMCNRVLGWRLLVLDNLGRMRPGRLGIVLYQALRPLWKICRSLLFWRLQGKSNDSH